VDDAGNVAKDGQKDVNEQVAATSALEKDTKGWQENGDDDLEDVTLGDEVSK